MRKFAKLNCNESVYRIKFSTARAAVAFVVLAGMSIFGVSTSGLAQDNTTDAEDALNGPQIAGFRSARFGMSESETLDAIRSDFLLQLENVTTESNEEDGTSSLVVTVNDIFPGSEPARVAYIHGYSEKKLIQVNVVWGIPVTNEADPQKLVTTANVLRKYFLQLGFNPENTVINTRVDDRIVIVFRATDEQDRMVLLQLLSRRVLAAEGDATENLEPQFRVESLLLSYIEDVKDPDIFRIKKGDF